MFKDYIILIVEDDRKIQQQLKTLLEKQCKKFIISDNGEDGLIKYQNNHPDLVITDLKMPKMGGIEMSKKIKAINCFQPIILFSSFLNIEELQEAINIGINAFISKPIENINILLDEVHKILKNCEHPEFTNKVEPEHIEQEVIESNIWTDILHDYNESVDYSLLLNEHIDDRNN